MFNIALLAHKVAKLPEWWDSLEVQTLEQCLYCFEFTTEHEL